MSALAQESDHLSFNGVPIDGTLREYVSEMRKAGFRRMGKKDGVLILKGDFAGYKNCFLNVSTLDQKDLVNRISVIFPEWDTWSAISANYFNLKKLLTEKYGEPSEIVEKFDTYSEPEVDNSKMYALRRNNCNYYTTYELENGTIQLSIQNDGFMKGFVVLTYLDKINSEIIRQDALDDL